MAESTKAPKEVFLSYGRDPERVDGFVQKLQSDLEAEGISVWRDTDDIDPGSDWHNKIADGVYNCRAFLCVLTNKYINSRNCRGELFYANEKKKLIFPVLYEDIDWDKDGNSRGVGYVVNYFNRADFRPSKVDYQVAVKNLIEAMKGQGTLQNNGILSKMVYDLGVRERNRLFRKYVSEPGAGKARAILEGLGLEDGTIDGCFTNNSRKVVEAVQEGLTKWKDGAGEAPTWEVLLEAMEYAGIGLQYRNGLRKELGLPVH